MSYGRTKPIVIFGTGELAELAFYYFTHDSDRKIEAFTVDRDRLENDIFCGLPVVSYEDLSSHYPASEFDLFIAIGYNKLNSTRAEKYLDAKSRGYELATYVSSNCINYPDLYIGDNCFVMEGTQIQPFVKIGNNVIIWSGSLLSHHVTVQDHCFIAAHCVISGKVKIQSYCFVGVNATIRENIVLAKNTIVGAGALILNSTKENQSYPEAATKHSGIPSHRFQSLL